jgi:acetyl-CoA C-acetyltransferase
MGIGPVFAVPRLLKRHDLAVDDIDLWELNEAFASQCLYCRDTLHIDPDKYNVNGGSIAIGHPFGMTARASRATRCSKASGASAKTAVVSMCIGGGMGAAGLFEIY